MTDVDDTTGKPWRGNGEGPCRAWVLPGGYELSTFSTGRGKVFPYTAKVHSVSYKNCKKVFLDDGSYHTATHWTFVDESPPERGWILPATYDESDRHITTITLVANPRLNNPIWGNSYGP